MPKKFILLSSDFHSCAVYASDINIDNIKMQEKEEEAQRRTRRTRKPDLFCRRGIERGKKQGEKK